MHWTEKFLLMFCTSKIDFGEVKNKKKTVCKLYFCIKSRNFKLSEINHATLLKMLPVISRYEAGVRIGS